jgi:glyoxylase-like metal-dependent hydrolase (beta-lactamase superfamily II)
MTKKCLAALAAGMLLCWTAFGQDAKTVIDNASKAMGSLKTVEYSGSGFDFAIGQNVNPNAPWPKFIDKTYKRTMNFETPAYRMERIRLQGENPPRGGGQQPVVGEQTQNQTTVVTTNTPWTQQLELWMMPHGFLQAATKNNATVSTKTLGGKKYNVVTFTGQNKAKVNGYINEQNMVERVETWIDNAMLGDMLFDATYTDYKDFSGVKFPTRIVQNQGSYPIFDLRITDVKPNAPVAIQTAPAGGGAAAAGAAAAGAAATGEAPTEKLADGVYLVSGGYAALIVDFKPYIVVIEGGQSEERSDAVIAAAKKLIPKKRIRYVVNTHHHIDHSRGLRRYVAEGATIVTHRINAPYFERVFAAPKTLNPDALSKAKKEPTFETLTTKKVMTDGNHVIELHHMAGNGHNEGLILAYLPKEKILVEADAYNPPAQPNAPVPMPVSPYTDNLIATMDRLKLDVETIVPIHLPADGRKVTRAELMRMAGR